MMTDDWECNGWTNHEKATALNFTLRGKALDILSILPINKQKDYDSIVLALEFRYGYFK